MGADCLVNITRGMSFSRCFFGTRQVRCCFVAGGGQSLDGRNREPNPSSTFLWEPPGSFVVLQLGLASDNALDCASSARYERPCPLRSKAVGRRC
jgi:hypothetical protein